ncbi:MAG: DUF1499 domain-containing protein [Litorimonas sp.]
MADLTPVNEPANDTTIKPKVSGAKRRAVRRWVNRITWAVIILAPLVFALAAIGYKLGLFDLGFAFGTLNQKIGPLMLLLCGVMGIASLIAAFVVSPRKGLVPGVLGILITAGAFAKLGATKKAVYVDLPFIHDVTTDTQNPPVFGEVVMAERAKVEGVNTADYIGKKAPIFTDEKPSGEELVSALQTKAFPEIRPVILSDTKDVVFGEALATAKSMGWKIKEEDLASGRIDATDTTFWYGFDDDVTIRLRDSEGGGTIVDVRSLSRIGGSDLGKNAERVGEFLEKLAE